MKSKKNIFFASDFHLGLFGETNAREREMEICKWLEYASETAEKIILHGDCFDFWFEYKTVVPRGNVRFLATLQKITDKGVEVILFKGNHDMWMFGYLEQECGVKIISDELFFEWDNKKFFVHHGDGLGKGDGGYKFLKAIFRSKLCQWLFARVHPNLGIYIARKWSRGSRLANNERDMEYLGDDKEFITAYLIELSKVQPLDFCICGHRHLPVKRELPTGTIYVNTGEWVHSPHYALYSEGKLELIKWESSKQY